jgi:hypothetical protein
MLEIKTKKEIKFLLLEKNNSVNICETFIINKLYDFKIIPLDKKKPTLNTLLKETKNRIGNHAFFNWNICKNNCQEFIKEILVTLNKYNDDYKEFIFRDKIIKLYEPSDFTLHIINCVFIIINFIEKYILDNNIFY